MDEKDRNSEQNPAESTVEKESKPVQPEASENEFEAFMKQAEENDSAMGGGEAGDTSVLPSEEENRSEEAQPETQKSSEASLKKKKNGLIAVIVVLVLILIAATGYLIHSIVGKKTSAIDFDQTAVTVGDVKSTVGEYLYWYTYVDSYYYNYYSYYYSQIPEEQIREDTLNQMTYVNALYSKAVAAGYELTQEDIAQIDENIQSYETSAESSSLSVDEYMEKSFGVGFTIDRIRSYLEKQALAYRYYDECMKAIDDEYAGDGLEEKLEAEYAANKALYDLSDVSYWYFDSSDEDAQNKADAIVSAVESGTAFDAAIQSVTGSSTVSANQMKGYTASVISSNFSESAANWVFETADDGSYANKAGAITEIEESGVIYLLYVNHEPSRNETLPATIMYIRVDVSDDTTVKSADELQLAAKSQAASILNEYNTGDKTASAFEALAEKYDNGDNELISGDRYESMTNNGGYDAAVEAWAFESSRMAGDCEIVEGSGCYYILYYEGKEETPVWYQSVLTNLVSNAQSDWQEALMAEFTDSIVTNDDVIQKTIDYLHSLSAV